ncbi:MAG: transposase [Armatimonadota bacterium]|nr:MAG: transposase [Armatimonadota bacterium]
MFTSEVFGGLLHEWDVKPRFGAVGKHGSIAVTERVILTLKYEWLNHVPVIRGLDHLSQLLHAFEIYYNKHRGHATLGGAIPLAVHRGEEWHKPEKTSKTLPVNVERRVFADTQITAYRLAA